MLDGYMRMCMVSIHTLHESMSIIETISVYFTSQQLSNEYFHG